VQNPGRANAALVDETGLFARPISAGRRYSSASPHDRGHRLETPAWRGFAGDGLRRTRAEGVLIAEASKRIAIFSAARATKNRGAKAA
jgi:hypothetical protein